MNPWKYVCAALLAIPLTVSAQTSPQYTSSEIIQGLQKLNTLGSALYIAAHPDDENTRLLAWLAKEKKFRTGYLSLTRGDGGQNLIGNEQSELLGLIRTQELLAARKVDGAEQFFSRAIDFGFSKNPAETFRIWDKERVLADAVFIIRKFRPDIIITRFPEDERAGHGQHSASAIIAREAFLAAGDPKRFPEQLSQVSVWSPLRIVWNTANFGGNNTTSEDQLKVEVGNFNPLLGQGYGEIAAESRTNHKSQGFGSPRQRGNTTEYFLPVAGQAANLSPFEGINTSWDKLDGGKTINTMISSVLARFNSVNPSASVPELVNILREITKLKEGYWKTQKTTEIKDLIAAAAGLWFESYTLNPIHALGDTVSIRNQVLLQSGVKIALKQVGKARPSKPLIQGEMQTIAANAPASKLTNPYWLSENHGAGMFTVPAGNEIGRPENEPAISTTFVFDIGGTEITYERPVVYKYTDQVRGEVYQPLIIAPKVTATLDDKSYVFQGNSPREIGVTLHGFAGATAGRLTAKVPAGWKAEPSAHDFMIDQAQEKKFVFTVTPGPQPGNGKLELSISTGTEVINRSQKSINYPHIPLQSLFPLAEARLEQIDLKTGGKRIAYIPGAGDLVPQALQQIGYNVSVLTDNQIINGDLSTFDAIITGVRLYNVNDQMNLIQPKLLDYVKNGGTLLVQYNVSSPLKTPNIGPLPFRISRDRVTDEFAEVRFLKPEHPVLNYPNKITSKDFEGWVQERGLYFVTDADAGYQKILSMNDPGENPSDGSLLVADYGKGRFIYTSLVFFRELPAGVPGAYRLFVNLITKNNSK